MLTLIERLFEESQNHLRSKSLFETLFLPSPQKKDLKKQKTKQGRRGMRMLQS